MSKPENYASVWDALADTPGQAANLRARAELMRQIAALVKRQDWTQVEAASHCGVTQPRINDLLRGRVSRFSLDALVNISTALGCRVRVDLEAAEGRVFVAQGADALLAQRPSFADEDPTGLNRRAGVQVGLQGLAGGERQGSRSLVELRVGADGTAAIIDMRPAEDRLTP